MFEYELLLEELCHWYETVPYGAVAAADRVTEAPLYTFLFVGCVVKVGAATDTVTETEFESL